MPPHPATSRLSYLRSPCSGHPWPEPHCLDHPKVQSVPMEPDLAPDMDHSGRTTAGKGDCSRRTLHAVVRVTWLDQGGRATLPTSMDHHLTTMNRAIAPRIHLDQSLKGLNQNVHGKDGSCMALYELCIDL
ncbi:hypothetical protein F511_31164 [Dorcoceras hygrometricum]|uniref:Uncharacterized protein n=1 Tax=Dorcoceras hygrometricum TaxID=472368 RepID=A0A2Z7AFX5_9LAMI|nr:hypothetical protein F511_31164 [Dorcoceras hygrometricum]